MGQDLGHILAYCYCATQSDPDSAGLLHGRLCKGQGLGHAMTHSSEPSGIKSKAWRLN